ncbi:MAG: hypothetical protein JNK67_00180 [Alphaproteobacteria bacterium]|nr:hypothetical protein [Alphaproteobacteria bacterium]
MAGDAPSVTVVALEGSAGAVTAAYNPKELGVDKSVPWQLAPSSRGESPTLQFSGSTGRTLSIHLLFGDTSGSASVQPNLDRLQRMAAIQSEAGPEDQRRPPRVALRWPGNRIPEFVGVIEALSLRYEALRADGTPVAAVAQLRIREAARAVSMKKAAKRPARRR